MTMISSILSCGISQGGKLAPKTRIFSSGSNIASLSLSLSVFFFFLVFLGATKHLYNWLCPSVGLLVCRLVG